MLVIVFCLISFLFLVICFYLHASKNHDYWKKRNVKHDKPLPVFGNHLPNVLVKRIMTYVGVELYNKYPNEKIVGYFRGRIPELIVRDLDIIKQIIIKDFPSFHSRGGFECIHKDTVIHSLFFLVGTRWGVLRQRLAAAFTAAKVKAMFPLILKCSDKLQQTTDGLVMKCKEIEAFELMAAYSMECIGSIAFGVEMDAIYADYPDFLDLCKEFFNKTTLQTFSLALEELYPDWTMLHRASAISKLLSAKMIKVTQRVIQERSGEPCGRNDLMDILIDMQSTGKTTIKSPLERNPDGSMKEYILQMDLKSMTAHITGFLFAGFESTASVASFTMYQLAFRPEIQHRIQKEIDQVISKHGRFNYEALCEMSLLEKTLKESLRMLPPAGLIRRVCNKEYTIPGTDVTIDPGVRILIPIQALHMDANYFENPEEFKPERFAPEAKKPPEHAYMPFGEGPRKCPGTRLAHFQSMVGVAAILQKYTVSPTPKLTKRPKILPTSYLVQVIEGGVPLKLTPRNKDV